MEYTTEELTEARRQIDSVVRKLTRALRTLEERPETCRPQITLAKRRLRAMEIAGRLIEERLNGGKTKCS